MCCIRWPTNVLIFCTKNSSSSYIICSIVSNQMYNICRTNPSNNFIKQVTQSSSILNQVRSINKMYKNNSLRIIDKEINQCSMPSISSPINHYCTTSINPSISHYCTTSVNPIQTMRINNQLDFSFCFSQQGTQRA